LIAVVLLYLSILGLLLIWIDEVSDCLISTRSASAGIERHTVAMADELRNMQDTLRSIDQNIATLARSRGPG
jgi:hypothetical protein